MLPCQKLRFWSLWLWVWLCSAARVGYSRNVTGRKPVLFIITSEVNGAVFPTDHSSHCDKHKLAEDVRLNDSCRCIGGQHRIQYALGATRASVVDTMSESVTTVTLDTGGFFFGSGLSFPTFNGNASALFFALSGYNGWALAFRDIVAGGVEFFLNYASLVRSIDIGLPPAVITNLNRDGFDSRGHISEYTLIPLIGGETLALMSLLDPTHIYSSEPEFAGRLIDYGDALHGTLARLRRLPQRPSLIVCVINGIEETPKQATFNTDHGVDAAMTAIYSLIRRAIGLDLVIIANSDLPEGLTELQNIVGDTVFVLATNAEQGAAIETLSVTYEVNASYNSNVADAKYAKISLGCDSGIDTTSAGVLEELDTALQQVRSYTSGYLNGKLDGRELVPAENCHAPSIFGFNTSNFCGCRVTDCSAGLMVADAIRWTGDGDLAFINSGSIRGSLQEGLIGMAEVNRMLPFADSLVRLRLPGSVLRAVFDHGMSGINRGKGPSGRFLQVSNTVQVTWALDSFKNKPNLEMPKVVSVFVSKPTGYLGNDGKFELLNDDAWYIVVTSSFLANGGDGFYMLKEFEPEPVYGSEVTAVLQFLELFGSPPDGGYDVEATLRGTGRVRQVPAIYRAKLGMICNIDDYSCEKSQKISSSILTRRTCDLLIQTIAKINNKTDGFYDEILPEEVFLDHVVVIPDNCTSEAVVEAVHNLASTDLLTAVIGPFSSGFLMNNATPEIPQSIAQSTVFFSTSITAQTHSNKLKYPNVIQLGVNLAHSFETASKLATLYGWKKMIVAYECEIKWAREIFFAISDYTAGSVGDNVRDIEEDMCISDTVLDSESGLTIVRLAFISETLTTINQDPNGFYSTTFPPDGMSDGLNLLHAISKTSISVIFLVASPTTQRKIFAASANYDNGRLSDVGFAWLSADPSPAIYTKPDGTIDKDAQRGAAGLLGVAMPGSLLLSQSLPPDNVAVDALLMFGHAMSGVEYYDNNPKRLFAAAKSVKPFNGARGFPVSLDSQGNLVSKVSILNLQSINNNSITDVSSSGGTYDLEFVTVGSLEFGKSYRYSEGSNTGGIVFFADVEVIFMGKSRIPPSDRYSKPLKLPIHENGTAVGVGVVAGIAIILAILFKVQSVRSEKKRSMSAKASMNDFLEELRRAGLIRSETNVITSLSNNQNDLPKELERSKIKLVGKLGSGFFGDVHKGLLEHSDGGTYSVAVKSLKKENEADIEDFLMEAVINHQFRHTNVVKLLGICSTSSPVLLVNELCEEGSLVDFLRRHRNMFKLSTRQNLGIIVSVAKGINYLHNHLFVHRDIAARNVLVSADFVFKICDFGMTRSTSERKSVSNPSQTSQVYISRRCKIPVQWSAPEVLDRSIHSFASDVWSLGILAWEVFTAAEKPYGHMPLEAVWQGVVSQRVTLDRPEQCPLHIWNDVISPCFTYDMRHRPLTSDVLTACDIATEEHDKFTELHYSPGFSASLVEAQLRNQLHEVNSSKVHTSPESKTNFKVKDTSNSKYSHGLSISTPSRDKCKPLLSSLGWQAEKTDGDGGDDNNYHDNDSLGSIEWSNAPCPWDQDDKHDSKVNSSSSTRLVRTSEVQMSKIVSCLSTTNESANSNVNRRIAWVLCLTPELIMRLGPCYSGLTVKDIVNPITPEISENVIVPRTNIPLPNNGESQIEVIEKRVGSAQSSSSCHDQLKPVSLVPNLRNVTYVEKKSYDSRLLQKTTLSYVDFDCMTSSNIALSAPPGQDFSGDYLDGSMPSANETLNNSIEHAKATSRRISSRNQKIPFKTVHAAVKESTTGIANIAATIGPNKKNTFLYGERVTSTETKKQRLNKVMVRLRKSQDAEVVDLGGVWC